MQLVINTYGSYLKKKNNCFEIKNKDNKAEISCEKIRSILISTSATITTDAIALAVEKNIDIIFLDSQGFPYGRIWHSKLGSTTLIRRRQLEGETSKLGFKLAHSWAINKVENQIIFLKDLKKNRPQINTLDPFISKLEQLHRKMKNIDGNLIDTREKIMGYEGLISRNYFTAISCILPDKWKFEGRSRNPAIDYFNCLLNYGYGILYSQVEKNCIIAGLDPYIGFIHTDNYNKKSLVFDIIEMFRIIVDRTVVKLFTKSQVKNHYFEKIVGGIFLNKEGKSILITAINETFEKQIEYKNRRVKWRNIIQLECHNIAKTLIKGNI